MQQHHLVWAEVSHQALLFVEVDGDAFVVVEGLAVVEAHGELYQRQQAFRLGGDGGAGIGTGVQHAGGASAGLVDGGVDDEGRDIHLMRAVGDLVALGADLHQGGSG